MRGHSQLLDEELEVVVTGQRHHGCLRIGNSRTDRGGDRPPQGTRLTRIDPVVRTIDVQHLRRGDLGQSDSGDVAGLGPEGAAHLLVDALGLQRRLVEVGAAQHRPLALVALLDPLPIPLDRTPVTFAGSREKHLQAALASDTEEKSAGKTLPI